MHLKVEILQLLYITRIALNTTELNTVPMRLIFGIFVLNILLDLVNEVRQFQILIFQNFNI
jgi:hypothetical protein